MARITVKFYINQFEVNNPIGYHWDIGSTCFHRIGKRWDFHFILIEKPLMDVQQRWFFSSWEVILWTGFRISQNESASQVIIIILYRNLSVAFGVWSSWNTVSRIRRVDCSLCKCSRVKEVRIFVFEEFYLGLTKVLGGAIESRSC